MAFLLVAIFVPILTTSSLEARRAFVRSQARAELSAVYSDNQNFFEGLRAGQVRSQIYQTNIGSVSITAKAKDYDRARIETEINVSGAGQTITFRAIRNNELVQPITLVGSALCSTDFLASRAIGWSVGSAISDHRVEILPLRLPLDPLLPLTDLAVRAGIAFVTADSNQADLPDLFVIDISDSKDPRIIGSLDTGPGLAAIAVAGSMAFAAESSQTAQLQVFDLSNPKQPRLVAKYKLPLPEASSTAPFGTTIFYDDRGLVYLGTAKWDGEELNLIDVSLPTSPRKVSGLEIGGQVNDIWAWQGLVYAASAGINQLTKIDWWNITQPIITAIFNPDGWSRQSGKVLDSFGENLVWGRTAGGFNIQNDHEIFFWNYSTSTPLSADIAGGVYGLVVDRQHIFMATRSPDQEFAVSDSGLDQETMMSYALPAAPQTLACDLDKLYLLAHTAPVIYEIKKTITQ